MFEWIKKHRLWVAVAVLLLAGAVLALRALRAYGERGRRYGS